MESEKQSVDTVRSERSSAREDEEVETFFSLIRRFGELRKKEGELSMIRSLDAHAGDHDRTKRKKKIESANDDFNHDQDKKKKGESVISNWVPCFLLEDFGEGSGSRRSPPPKQIKYELQKQEVTINSKRSFLFQEGDNDGLEKHDDDHCGLNLKLAL